MKISMIYIPMLPLLVLSACSKGEPFVSKEIPHPREALTLRVSAGDFAADGMPNTRATETADGKTITFEAGDRVGVTVLDGSNNLLANNIPYEYNGSTWAFDNSNTENKNQCYYDSKAVTYIVYYPYSPKADGVTDETALKNQFAPLFNQSTQENYRASDLMLFVTTPSSPSKNLDVSLTHAYASFAILPKVTCTLANSEIITYISSGISDVSLSTGGNTYIPLQGVEGDFRCIVPAGTTSDVRCFYTRNSITYSSTVSISGAATANTRYTTTQTINLGSYGLDNKQVGDFYCKDGSGNAYLIPGEIIILSEEQQKACLGVVFYVGDIKGDNYGLLDGKLSGSTHGLVAAVQNLRDPDNADKQMMLWTYGGYEFVSTWLSDATWSGEITRPADFISIKGESKMQGYANTLALQEYNKVKESQIQDNNLRVKPIYALAKFVESNPTPASSSGWYWPSVCELKWMCWGQGNEKGTAGRDLLNIQLQKVSGTEFDISSWGYWSSAESSISSNRAWYVDFYGGYVDYYGKYGDEFSVRPVLAF